MSKNTTPTPQNEEVDLGQLFKIIGSAFDKLFKFIGKILNGFFLAFVWLVFFIRKNIIFLAVAAIVGFGFGLFLEKTLKPIYKSSITVKQNYKTGQSLYDFITYTNSLVSQNDYTTLKDVFSLSEAKVSSISKFDIEPIVSDNAKLKVYDSYIKTLDSTIATTLDYNTFLKNKEDNEHTYQQIIIKAKKRKDFKVVFDKIVANINSNPFFKREQERDLVELQNRKRTIENLLIESDSLQNIYKRVLEKSNEAKGSEIGITFEGSTDKNKTKEYELYIKGIELRREIVEVDREISEKEEIIEVISNKQENGIIDNKTEVLGFSFSRKVFYSALLGAVMFFVLLLLRFLKFIEKYKEKIE